MQQKRLAALTSPRQRPGRWAALVPEVEHDPARRQGVTGFPYRKASERDLRSNAFGDTCCMAQVEGQSIG